MQINLLTICKFVDCCVRRRPVHQSKAFVEKVPSIRYSDSGSQSGTLFPLITSSPVGAIRTPFTATAAPNGVGERLELESVDDPGVSITRERKSPTREQ